MTDPIKEAFARAKADVDSLRSEIKRLSEEMSQLKSLFEQSNPPALTALQQTNTHQTPTHKLTELPIMASEPVKTSYNVVSSGNDGVPTNQPTNQQTNQRSGNRGVSIKANFNPTDKQIKTLPADEISHLTRVSEILASLDGLKKEVRLKFKRLTTQEMIIFTKIYEIDETGLDVTYDILAQSLNLSEISIRDYVRKIIAKGIPVVKRKENNKRILLSISDDLKQIASLQTIHQLREL